jgi:Ca-activated chloride channel family protein
MTPYTSFLADENVSLADRSNATRAGNESRRELSKSDGVEGFRQRSFKGQLQNSDQAAGASSSSFSLSQADKKMAGRSLSGPVSSPSRGTVSSKPNQPLSSIVADKLSDKSEPTESNLRQVGQKTFFRKNNQWQDSTVTDEQSKNAIRVKQFSREYFDLAAKHSGTLAKYIAFDEPVLVNLDDKTYQIDPEEPEKS